MGSFCTREEQLLKRITGPTTRDYWVYDHCGERMKLKPGWKNAQKEYNRVVVGLKGKAEHD
jgi:hypothetical protein